MLRAITRETLTGRTPSQALQLIISTLQSAQQSAREKEAKAKAASQMDKEGKPAAKTPSEAKVEQDDEAKEGAGIAPIINSARETIAGLTRPIDVGCAMSVLSFKETSRAYGSIIANNYIAVQIVVRNLNRDQQFVLHDVEYAVNADPSGRSGRFYSGRDKIVVRALAAAEGAFDLRNIVVHGSQSLGALLSTLVPIYGGGVGDAAAVFNGGFYPGLDKVWKDLSTDQLNLLNDTGFSSSSSSQTVVPKAGTVMFVTFIPSKQFEQGWWTQGCAASTALGTISKNQIKALVPLVRNAKTESAAPSIDLERAMQVCSYQALLQNNQEKQNQKVKKKPVLQTTLVPEKLGSETPAGLQHDDAACLQATEKFNKIGSPTEDDRLQVDNACKDATLFATVPKRLYRNWSGNSVALFEELSTTVVAGMHILDDKDLDTTVSLVTCNPDTTGKVQFPNPDTGSLECQLKGKNLDKINLLRLRNTNDNAFAEGSVTIKGGDNTAGTASFPTATLHGLPKADYAVYSVNKTGVETATSQTLHFDLSPSVTAFDPKSLSTPKNGDTIKVTGFHLGQVKEMHVKVDAAKDPAVFTVATAPVRTDKGLTMLVADVDKLGTTKGQAKISFILNDDKGTEEPIPLTLEYTPATAEPAANKALVKADVKNQKSKTKTKTK